MDADPPLRGPLRLREALVISFAILTIGGAWIYVGHRDRRELSRRLADLPEPDPAPDATALRTQIDGERLLDQARVAAATGDHDGAEAAYTELLRRHPLDHGVRFDLALSLVAAGARARAREHLQLLVSLPGDADRELRRRAEVELARLGQ